MAITAVSDEVPDARRELVRRDHRAEPDDDTAGRFDVVRVEPSLARNAQKADPAKRELLALQGQIAELESTLEEVHRERIQALERLAAAHESQERQRHRIAMLEADVERLRRAQNAHLVDMTRPQGPLGKHSDDDAAGGIDVQTRYELDRTRQALALETERANHAERARAKVSGLFMRLRDDLSEALLCAKKSDGDWESSDPLAEPQKGAFFPTAIALSMETETSFPTRRPAPLEGQTPTWAPRASNESGEEMTVASLAKFA